MTIGEPGVERTHPLPDGGALVMVHGAVYINAPNGEEVVSWTSDEWEADVEAVTATLNAMSEALAHGATSVAARIAAYNGMRPRAESL